MKNTPAKNAHFRYEERVIIEALRSEGYGTRKIARSMGRPKSSVADEIRRNSVNGEYIAWKAHLKAYQTRWRARRDVLKIAMDRTLRDYVEEKLSRFWSPEGIAGRLQYVERDLPLVGKDAIYGYVASSYGRKFKSFLWYRGRKRKQKPPRETIDGRTMIDERPKSIEKRRVFGHWEADFIVSGKNGSGALLVFVERKSRYTLIFKLADRKVATINEILHLLCGAQLVVRTLTIDNDICFRHHPEMSRILGAPIFFCHPYHSWEKGSVEKMNQLIRRFIPKRTDIAIVPEAKIRWIESILNGRPLKCLGFYTPAEVAARDTGFKTFVAKTTSREYIYQ